MPFYNFKKDFEESKTSVKEVCEKLETSFGAKILDLEDTYRYDILAEIDGRQITFEVKEDFLCEKTGNVGLEFEYRGRPSGIQTSEADYYVYKLHTKDFGIQFVMHTKDVLLEKIENEKYFRIVNGGDKGSNSMNYLFKYSVFMEDGLILTLDKNQIL